MIREQAIADYVNAPPDRRRVSRTPVRDAIRPDQRIRLLGRSMDRVRPEEVMAQIQAWVAAGETRIVANHNLHSLYLIDREPRMRALYAMADIVQIDSRPLILFGRLVGRGCRSIHRSTYLDWRDHFWSLADRLGWRVMILGGAPGVAATAAERLGHDYPGARIAVRDGYFDATPGSADNDAVVVAVRDFRPQILFVGMGMPRQEAWIANNLAELPASVVLPVGAAFDYEAGVQSAAPRWTGRMGVEWLYRLATQPRRLFVRYLIEPWFLIPAALRDIAGRGGR